MKENNSTDFINFGTFNSLDAYVLKPELEKKGVTVKLLYPGTEISPDATGNASFTELTLLIEEKDFEYANKICQKMGIERVKNMTRINKSNSYAGLYLLILFIIAASILLFYFFEKMESAY
jgi:hypothetical protein